MKLRAAIAAPRAEHVPGETLRVHTDEHLGLAGNLSVHQSDVLGFVDIVAVADDGEVAELRGNSGLGHAMDQLLGPETIGHELGHGHERETVLLRDLVELGPSGHGPIGIQNLADDTGRNESGQPGEIHAGLGLTHPLQHSTGPGPQGKDVTRAAKIGGHGGRIDRDVDGGGAIAGRDAGGNPEAALRVDADGECGRELLGVAFGHGRESELIAPLAGQSQTDQSASVQGHEVDHLGRGQFGGTDEISLVLAIFIVGHDDDLSVTKVFDRLLDGTKSRHRIPAYR